MHTPTLARTLLLLCSLGLGARPAQAALESLTALNLQPEQYSKVEYDVLLRFPEGNPCRSAEVALDLLLVSPSGKQVSWPGFHVSGEAGSLAVWRLRCALTEPGEYRGECVLTLKGKRDSALPVKLTVAPSKARGFLLPAGPWLFRYDNGTPFRGLGENIGWEARSNDDSKYFRELNQSPRYHYEYMLGQLAAKGGNFFRTWMCSWNLPLEWNKVVDTDRYTPDKAVYNASAIRRMDELVRLCDDLGLHMMLTLDTAGSFLGSDWERNAYNRRNGGPAATPQEFFSSPAARAQYRDRLRALIAHWGYSPSIAVWEFFNEVDNLMYGVTPRIPDAVVSDWHAEMAATLKELDPLHRLVSTSISHRDVEGLNSVPAIDFNQRHIYCRTSTIPEVLRDYALKAAKPYVIGECAYEWDWSKDFNTFQTEMDRDFRRGLWLGLFSPTPILPLSWWWEYFDSRGRTADLAPVRAVLEEMLSAGGGSFVEEPLTVTGSGVKALGVSCGDLLCLYVWNEYGTPVEAGLGLPAKWSGTATLRTLNPETGLRTETLSSLQTGQVQLVTLEPHGHRVLLRRASSTTPKTAP